MWRWSLWRMTMERLEIAVIAFGGIFCATLFGFMIWTAYQADQRKQECAGSCFPYVYAMTRDNMCVCGGKP